MEDKREPKHHHTMDVDGAPGGAAGSAWEQGLDETWKAVHEADDGTLDEGDMQSARRKRMRRLRDTFGSVKRGMIRNLVVVIDTSAAMAGIDFRWVRALLLYVPKKARWWVWFTPSPKIAVAQIAVHNHRCTYAIDVLLCPCLRANQLAAWRAWRAPSLLCFSLLLVQPSTYRLRSRGVARVHHRLLQPEPDIAAGHP